MLGKFFPLGFFLFLALAGCQGLSTHAVGPGGSLDGGIPAAAKDGAADDELPDAPAAAAPVGPSGSSDGGLPPPASVGFSGGSAPSPHDLIASSGDTPQAGGVSALPGAVEGGEGSKTPFDFMLTGTAQPVCVEPEPEISSLNLFPRLNYFVRGDVGAVLLDGTAVPLSGCEVVTLRFQTGSGSMVHCQDISAKSDCSLFGRIKLRPGEKPKIYFLTMSSQFDDCEDMEAAHFPATNDLTFLPSSGKLSECQDPVLNDSILSHPSFRSKVLK